MDAILREQNSILALLKSLRELGANNVSLPGLSVSFAAASVPLVLDTPEPRPIEKPLSQDELEALLYQETLKL